MIRIRPDYYDKFTCIADACTITCCQEWKIAVDADTNRKWKKILPPDTMENPKKNLSAYTTHKDDIRVIGLDENHRCPFLNDKKLCKLVTAYGDKVLSETCAQFPREVHKYEKHEEETLMPCCPAVIDIFFGENEIEYPKTPSEEAAPLFLIREKVIELLQNETDSLEMELLMAFYVLQELADRENLTAEVIEEYFSEKNLAQLKEAIVKIDADMSATLEERNELLQDLAVNYQKEGLYEGYLKPVIMCAEQISPQAMEQEIDVFQQEMKKYQPLMGRFMVNEIFSDLLMPDTDMEGILVQLQWIAMEYATIIHSIFLKWKRDDCKEIPYEMVRDYMVVISRMTGYEEDDIYEYLENSFEELIWDWGYFALVVGR